MKRPVKVLRIDKCVECRHHDNWYCTKSERNIKPMMVYNTIPKWCELEDD